MHPTLPLIALALMMACGPSGSDPHPNVAMRFVTADGAAYHCMDAEVSRVGTDRAGSYRLTCPTDGDAALEIAHGEGPSGPVITAITLTAGRLERVIPADRGDEVAALGLPACTEGGPGQAQLARHVKDGRLAYGSHVVRLAYPCGEGIFQIGKPLNQR